MIERLFLDGIHGLSGSFSVDERIENAAAVFADTADSAFSRLDGATMMAQIASNLMPVHWLPEHCFLHVPATSTAVASRQSAVFNLQSAVFDLQSVTCNWLLIHASSGTPKLVKAKAHDELPPNELIIYHFPMAAFSRHSVYVLVWL
jgi:hypothetical protein